MLICPHCGKSLQKKDRAYVCAGRHSFDLSRQGYVNLLPVSARKTENPGDNAAMIACRRRFLSGGAYSPLREKVCEILQVFRPSSVLDCGCADGYYTEELAKRFPCVFGFDISRDAVRLAAARDKKAVYFVASSFRIPVSSASVDAVTRIFAPDAPEEFLRVLRRGGAFVEVLPGERHLSELKEILYETVRPNRVPSSVREGMKLLSEEELIYAFTPDADGRRDLYGMTPYAYKTGKSGEEKLAAAPVCPVTAHFVLRTYVRI